MLGADQLLKCRLGQESGANFVCGLPQWGFSKFIIRSSTLASFSIWHWMIVGIWLFVLVFPMWRIATKAGFSGAWSLLMLIPLLNVVMMWVFAFVKWPTRKNDQQANR